MIIKSLELVNFKNQQNLKVDFSESVTNIFGANGAGKTTIVDAVSFLLWQKDSRGNADTKMRPYDKNGELIHDIDTSVKAVFTVDNINDFTLEVIFKEKWTKVSGSDERKLTGNTTEYYIDGVPKKAKDYSAFVDEWFCEPWFSLTSNPAAFPALKWQEQRQLLINLVDEIDNKQIASVVPEVTPILADIEKYGIDDLRAKLQKEKKGYDKQVKELPIRIDERRKTLSGIENPEELRKKAELTLLKYKEPYEKLMTDRIAIVNGDLKTKREGEIAVIEAKMETIRALWREKQAEVKSKFEQSKAQTMALAKSNSEKVSLLRRQLLKTEQDIASYNERLGRLENAWSDVNDEVFCDTECPCCHRPYTEDMLQPMLEAFNKSKSERLEDINSKGEEVAKALQNATAEKSNLLLEINGLTKYEAEDVPRILAENNKAMNEALAKLPPLESMVNPETKEAYWDLVEALKLRKNDLEEVRLDVSIQLQDIDKKIAEARLPVDEAQDALNRLRLDAETLEVISRLQAEKQNAMLSLGDAESKLNALDKFVVAKMNLLSDKINSLFENIDFKLFETNISNEGIRETCELMMHGVPYRQLSNAEKCRAGMEVIRAISKKRGFSNPVFVDNREGVTDIGEAPGQVINFYVSPEDRKLRVSHE